MGEYIKYRDAVLRKSVEQTKPNTRKEERELGGSIISIVLGDPVERKTLSSLTKKEKYLSKLYQGLIEIHSSIEVLEAHEVYITRFPYSGTKINKSQHLRYVIETYLQEFYILKERIKAYITAVGRAYKDDYRHDQFLKRTRPLFALVPEVFKNLLNARGVHVHQSRYTESDLERLDSLEFFMKVDIDENLTEISKRMYKDHYLSTRKKWKKTIKSNNESIIQVFDLIFRELHSIVFTDAGNFRYPRKNKHNNAPKPTQ